MAFFAAMALQHLCPKGEPDPGTCNALHIHLVEYACEELWALADGDDELAETADEQAEYLMQAGGTASSQDLCRWLKDRMPTSIYEKVLQEAARVGWPFMPMTNPAMPATPTVGNDDPQGISEPLSGHQHWQQLRDVMQESMRMVQGGIKQRRITADQKQLTDERTDRVMEAAGALPYNDALLLLSQHACMPIADLVHEWNFEVDWQHEWGSRKPHVRKSRASSSSGRQRLD